MDSQQIQTNNLNIQKKESKIEFQKQNIEQNQLSQHLSLKYRRQYQVTEESLRENYKIITKCNSKQFQHPLRKTKWSEAKIISGSLPNTKNQQQLIQSSYIQKLKEDNQHNDKINSRQSNTLRGLISPTLLNQAFFKSCSITDSNSQVQLPLISKLKQSINLDSNINQFTFYSPKFQDNKQRLPKEFQVLPCSKNRYFI